MADMHVMYAHECTWTFRRSCCVEDGCIKDMGMTFGEKIYIYIVRSQLETWKIFILKMRLRRHDFCKIYGCKEWFKLKGWIKRNSRKFKFSRIEHLTPEIQWQRMLESKEDQVPWIYSIRWFLNWPYHGIHRQSPLNSIIFFSAKDFWRVSLLLFHKKKPRIVGWVGKDRSKVEVYNDDSKTVKPRPLQETETWEKPVQRPTCGSDGSLVTKKSFRFIPRLIVGNQATKGWWVSHDLPFRI